MSEPVPQKSPSPAFLTADGWAISKPLPGDELNATFVAIGTAPSTVSSVSLDFQHTKLDGTPEAKDGSPDPITGVSIDWTGGVGPLNVGKYRSGTLSASGGSSGKSHNRLTVVQMTDPTIVQLENLRQASTDLSHQLNALTATTIYFVTGRFDPKTDARVTCVLSRKDDHLVPVKVFDGIPFGKAWFAYFTQPRETFLPNDPIPPPYSMRVIRTNIVGDVTHLESEVLT